MSYIRDLSHDEIRSGFLVTTDRKKVWDKELELHACLDALCQSLHIRYYAAYGTLLGAVRHQGFIPWDDDIDVFMTRPDYDKLCAQAGSLLHAPYQMRTSYNSAFTADFAKLLDDSTSAIEFPDRPDIPQGMFIDIFPLDSVPDSDDPQQLMTWHLEQELWLLSTNPANLLDACAKGYELHMPLATAREIVTMPKAERFHLFEQIAADSWGKSTRVNNLVEEMCSHKGAFSRTLLADTTTIPFETIQLTIMTDYDTVLTSYYDDWHQPVRGGSAHEGIVLSPDIPWRTYLQEIQP
ncbi:MAG TPA: hypothetical protein DEA67_08030 [Selenomonas sp.]|nr:hypothetical protein [Selenomonas sp.]